MFLETKMFRQDKNETSSVSAPGNRLKPTILFVAFLSLVVWAGSGWGADNSVEMSLTAREEYNDNIFYDDREPVEDMITTLAPALEVGRSSERMETSASARVESRYYRENRDLNATDQFYSGDAGISVSERLTVSAGAEFARDSRRERDVETTGILFENVVRDQWSAQVGGQYSLNEKTGLQLSAAFHEETYEYDTESEYYDFRYQQAGIALSRYLTEKTMFSAQSSYTLYEYPGQEIVNWSGTLGVSRQMTETVSGYVNLGGRESTFTYHTYAYDIDPETFQILAVPVDVDIEKSGFVGSLGVNYQGEATSIELSAEHDLQATSGASGTTQRTGIALTVTKRLTGNFYNHFTGRYFNNHSENTGYSAEEIDSWSIQLANGLQYRPVEWFSIAATYRYARVEDRLDRTVKENNAAWLVLDFRVQLLD